MFNSLSACDVTVFLNSHCDLEAPVPRQDLPGRISDELVQTQPTGISRCSLAHPPLPLGAMLPLRSVEFPSAHSGVHPLEMCCVAPHRDAQLLSSIYYVLSRLPGLLVPSHSVNFVVLRTTISPRTSHPNCWYTTLRTQSLLSTFFWLSPPTAFPDDTAVSLTKQP